MSELYFPHSGRAKHYWKLRSAGFRELLLEHGWGMRGGYAEKTINGVSIMQTIVSRNATYMVCCFQRKSDFWSEITRRERQEQADQRRRSFSVVASRGVTSVREP